MTMTLYHVTWAGLLPSIRQHGLIPSHTPNAWVVDAANQRSRGRTFLCTQERAEYWAMTMADGYVRWRDGDDLVILAVDVAGLGLSADSAHGEDYDGDFWTDRPIGPERLGGSRPAFPTAR